ncbi:MAG TPA: hypothetical protein VKA09_05440 [Nitrososphaeraceae archaeon]|nr:hypothetical protein [Nitrososphaeraceae archaeon]
MNIPPHEHSADISYSWIGMGVTTSLQHAVALEAGNSKKCSTLT